MDERAMQRVNEHHAAIVANHNVFFTALYGSQNYRLETPSSDVDTKAAVIPPFRSVMLNDKQVSKDILHENGEITSVKDIRLMFANFKKCNINFLEMLFSPYICFNPNFLDEGMLLQSNADFIANANPRRLFRAAAGMAKQKYIAFDKPFESKIPLLKVYGFDPKQLQHLVRLEIFMRTYLETRDFEASLIPTPQTREFLISLKTMPPSLETAKSLRQIAMDSVDKMMLSANHQLAENGETEREASNFLDNLSIRVLTKAYGIEGTPF